MKAKEVSDLTGLSVRTLHHWETLGLVSPARSRENHYREYAGKDLADLQQVLFFKECGFSLNKIHSLLSDKNFDREKAFQLQKRHLLQQKNRIDTMLETLEKSRGALKGGYSMDTREQFKGFNLSNNPFEEEAKQIWGEGTVNSRTAKIETLAPETKQGVGKERHGWFGMVANVRNEDPSCSIVQDAMDEMYRFFNANFGYHYSLEAFVGLGRMYVEDERFTKTIDSFGKGLSLFLSQAMGIYAMQQREAVAGKA